MNIRHLIFAALCMMCGTGMSGMRTTVTVHTDRYPTRSYTPVYVPTYYPVYTYPSYAYWPVTYTYDDFYYDYSYDSPISALGKAAACMGVLGLAVIAIDAILQR